MLRTVQYCMYQPCAGGQIGVGEGIEPRASFSEIRQEDQKATKCNRKKKISSRSNKSECTAGLRLPPFIVLHDVISHA